MEQLTPELLLAAYGNGIFPMADEDSDWEISWYSPAERGVLPLESFHIPHDLSRLLRQRQFEVTFDRDFEAVMRGCADRDSTWISEKLVAAYVALHEAGHAHSVECRQEGRLGGGLYGVRLGGAFFGESMFHRVRDASKVALVHLVERLKQGGFTLLDTQFVTPHLEQFDATEIGREEYLRQLANALHIDATW